ncbi:MAG: anti-sigma factor [Candidatus Acidiferrum sp.]
MNCDTYRELIEAYALGALDADERLPFEEHLATGCTDCSQKVAEARVLVSQLAYLAPDAEPSLMLKGRLMQTVRSEARAAKPAPVAKNAVPLWFWAGVAALFVFTVLEAWDARIMREEMRTVNEHATSEMQKRQELQQELALLHREQKILTDPASVKIPLPGQNPELPKLEATWHSELGIIVSGQKVTPLGEGRVLQLWLIPKAPGGKPVPSLAVRPEANGHFFLMVSNPPGAMGDTKALAITEEPAGGSAQPTTAPKWVGGIS